MRTFLALFLALGLVSAAQAAPGDPDESFSGPDGKVITNVPGNGGAKELPRGNGTLMLKIAFHDFRMRIYESLGRLVDTPAGALAFMDCYIDHTEGRPTKRVETTVRPPATFLLTQRDGTVVPALPEKVGGGATPAAAASAEDAMILGLQPVRI